MSFVLPGNQRQLRFTGESNALKDSGTPGGGVALGKPRVRKATTTPPPALVPAIPSIVPTSGRSRNTGMTPASPGNSARGNGSYAPAPIPSIRPGVKRIEPNDHSWDGDDQQATMAFDREGNDVLPGGPLRATTPPPPPRQVSVAPIPHFRPANPAVQTVIVPPGSSAHDVRQSKGAPLALWIFAAILAGILSFYVTPTVMSRFDPPPPAPAKG